MNEREESSLDAFIFDSVDNLFILDLFNVTFLSSGILGLIKVLTAISGSRCILELLLRKGGKETKGL